RRGGREPGWRAGALRGPPGAQGGARVGARVGAQVGVQVGVQPPAGACPTAPWAAGAARPWAWGATSSPPRSPRLAIWSATDRRSRSPARCPSLGREEWGLGAAMRAARGTTPPRALPRLAIASECVREPRPKSRRPTALPAIARRLLLAA